ncbi:hypothetical protein COCNU_06G016720 [Cocos nucifera]|uniref:Uncharacterized protein n=1 Tax=Cocos nucifera TaxID=13894 RepID=A0A8K0N3C0_COCNU|nr:hypothetical protein COCNU_06G016720 [Cocos nucifera]
MAAAIAAATLPNTAFLPKNLSFSSTSHQFLAGFSKRLYFDQKFGSRSKDLVGLVVASAAASSSDSRGAGRFYLNFTGFPFPLGPFLNRRTIRTELLKELDAPVEHIVLPTFAYEHKIFVGPFSRKFPRAQIWVAPRQWSWPINLPLEFFGIFRAKALKDEDTSTPWADEIEQKVLSSPEVDAVIFVPRRPPECISKESLLASAKNGLAVKILSKGKEVPEEPVVDNKINRQKGPSNLLEPTASFAQMSQKLIVSPIVKTLVFSKVPEKVRDWVDRIAKDWPFRRIIPAHFAAPINASRSDFLAAFAFLDELLGERFVTKPSLSLVFASLMGKATSYFPPDDMKTLSSLDEFLVSVGAVKKTVSGRKR